VSLLRLAEPTIRQNMSILRIEPQAQSLSFGRCICLQSTLTPIRTANIEIANYSQ